MCRSSEVRIFKTAKVSQTWRSDKPEAMIMFAGILILLASTVGGQTQNSRLSGLGTPTISGDQEVFQGQMLTLTCEFNSSDSNQTEWASLYFNDVKVEEKMDTSGVAVFQRRGLSSQNGNYTCTFSNETGESLPSLPLFVEVIDPCVSNPCQAKQTCSFQADSSLQCVCPKGFAVNSTGGCQDIDECDGFNPCQQKCTNTDGTYECSCFDGHSLNSLGKCDDGSDMMTALAIGVGVAGVGLLLIAIYALVKWRKSRKYGADDDETDE